MGVRIFIALALLCSTAHAQGPYVSWGMSAWWGQDTIGMLRKDGDATFDLRAGMRVHNVAVEAFWSPSPDALSLTGVDAKLLLPLGEYVSPYARLRLARMTVDIGEHYDPSLGRDVGAIHDSGLGGGAALGVQFQFPAYPFGLLCPAWFAAPAGPKRIGGVFFEVGHDYYAPEHFWRFGWGLAWGGSF